MKQILLQLIVVASLVVPGFVAGGPASAADVKFGPVTDLPMPRYVSIKASEANVRRGPSLSHRIDWVFKRKHLPVQITAEYGHWRRIQDMDGAGGWVHYSLLSGSRYVVVTGEEVPFYRKPRTDEPVMAKAQSGVVARLGDCMLDWCQISADSYEGWVEKAQIWGIRADELRN